MKHWVITLALSLTTFDWGAWASATTGFTAETLTTHWGLANGCHENNQRVFGTYPSTSRLVVGEAVRIGLVSTAMWVMHRQHHHRIEKWLGYGMGGMSGVLAAGNLQRCGV